MAFVNGRIDFAFKAHFFQILLFKPLKYVKNLTLSKLKAFAFEKLDITEDIEFVSTGYKTWRENEKMLVTSIFSFPRMLSNKRAMMALYRSTG